MFVIPSNKLLQFPLLRFAMSIFFALTFALIMALWPRLAYAGDITVDGSSCTLPNAISAANTNSTVGGCSIIGTPGTETLHLTASTYALAVNGSYASNGPNATPSITTNIIISSTVVGGSTVERSGGNDTRLFHVAAAGNLTLRGVTVQKGKVSSPNHGGGLYNAGKVALFESEFLSNTGHRGGGIYNTGAITLTGVLIYNNIATEHGAGLYNNNNGRTAVFSDTQVISNTATNNGGGIYNNTSNSIITITNSEVISNNAVSGAGILNSTGSFVYATGSEIRRNKASGSGGGLQNNAGTMHLTSMQVISNSAGSDGGGFYNNNTGTVTITNTQVISNEAISSGGGIFNGNIVRVVDSDVSQNKAGQDGGGLYNTAGTSTIVNTSFIGNRAGTGGAISSNVNGTKVILSDSEIIENSANGRGGGIYINSGGSSAIITSTQVFSNHATSDGGGIAIQPNSSVTMTDTQIRGNHTNQSGGGIFGNTNTTINLTNGEVVLNNANRTGGGVFVDNRATLINSDVISNTAGSEGGGIYNGFNSDLTLTNSNVIGNRGTEGGGLYNGKTATVTNSDFLTNTASSGSGGGIQNTFTGNLMLTDSDVVANRSTSNGGGINNENHLVLVNSDLRNNRAQVRGGGLYVPFAGDFTLTSSDVVANTAGGSGGGIFSESTSATTISGTHIISNTSGGSGGGIYGNATLTLNNSELVSNTAVSDGGGIYNTQGVNISNSRVISNVAGGDGGGIYANASATVTNSPVYFNRAQGIGGGLYAFSTATLNHSDVVSNYSGADGGGIYGNNNVNLTNSHLISNTAEGSGGGLYSDLYANLTNSNVVGNHAGARGGGVYNSGHNTLVVANSDFTSNRAESDGGGLYVNVTTTVTLDDSDFLTNTTMGRGGGLFANTASHLVMTNSEIRANTSTGNGGGFLNNGTAIVSDSEILSNTSSGRGGGLYNNHEVTLFNFQVISNTSVISGGGLYNTGTSTVTLNLGNIIGNQGSDGGGIFTSNVITFANLQITNNRATHNGGGLYNSKGTITATLSNILDNHAGVAGGGLYQSQGRSTITATGFIDNDAGVSGGGAYIALGSATINQSCIVNNTALALDYRDNSTIDATNNWWGAPDGPSGAGLGAGDSVTNSVTFAPFASAAILSCPTRSTSISFGKSVSPAVDLLPGQPLTYTLVVTNNNNELSVHNLLVVDLTPAEFVMTEMATAGIAMTSALGGFRIPSIDGGEVATFYLRGVVTRTLNADTVFTNTATISNSLAAVQTSTTSANVNVPLLSWSQAIYTASEAIGTYSATVTISPTNPYTTVTVQAGAPSPTIANITFTVGSNSQPVGVLIPNDSVVLTRAIPLNLVAASGAAIAPAGGEATVFTIEDDAAPALTVSKIANAAPAWVGDTITYTVRITNTGNVTLTTIEAGDDKLGPVLGLAGQLNPGATRSASLTIVVQTSDLPGPLVNTITVTGTDIFATAVNASDSASVALTTPAVSFTKQANPAGALMPGQPLLYTLTITNEEARDIDNLYVTDPLPPAFVLSNTNTSGPAISFDGSRHVIAKLLTEQVATIEFTGAVDATLTGDIVLENRATLTNSLFGTLSESTSNDVYVPTITWAENDYLADESRGIFTATLLLSPANPYAAVSVNVIVTDSNASALQVAEVQVITFPPNSSSQPVVVTFADDGVAVPRTISLQLQSPTGASIGGGASGAFSAVTLYDPTGLPGTEQPQEPGWRIYLPSVEAIKE